MVLLSLIPQIHLWIVRGREWNGAYVSAQGDEVLYSGYINALIEGRKRKNDPFGARDNSTRAPLPESLFSIQFVPAYMIALPARAFDVSASTAFIVLIAAAALFASLSVFYLLNHLTKDHLLAAMAIPVVLCLGGVAGSYGIFGTPIDIAYPVVPFLRRYEPAAVFPLFFVIQLLVWHSLTTQNKRLARILATMAGLTVAVLMFSYLYLWTGAVAWLACISLLWFYFRPSDWRRALEVLTTIGAMTAIALGPYVFLLSHRDATLDQPLILDSTHSPDLLRIHEILGAATIIVLIVAGIRGRIERTDPRVLYVASLALLPFCVFNQQIVTGKTMQSFHFEIFVVNYSTLVGLMIMLTLLWNPLPRRLLIWIAGLSLAWGIIAMGIPSRLVFVPLAVVRDESIPVLLRLKQLAQEDGTLADLRAKGQASTLVFSPNVTLIAQLPTWTSQGTLLDMTGVYCGGVTRQEQKEFFYMHLYYSKADPEALRKVLSGTLTETHDELSSARSVIFGHERIFQGLSSKFTPIQPDEIDREVLAYQTYVKSFSREEAVKRSIAYAVVSAPNFDFGNLDRWYERDAGERVGAYSLYRLKLRN